MTREEFEARINPLPKAVYGVDVGIDYLAEQLESWSKRVREDGTGGLDLYPDFQRGHVWTLEQKQAFILAMMRGVFPSQGCIIQFNSPWWNRNQETDMDPEKIVIVDGLQRLTAMMQFRQGKFSVLGMYYEDTKGLMSITTMSLRFSMLTIPTRKELLEYYLGLNAGGTPHSSEELDRVRTLLIQEERKSASLESS